MSEKRIPKWTLYLIGMMVVSLIGVATISVLYADHVATQNQQKWCELLTTLDSAYSTTPPSSPLGQAVADSVHDLTIDFGC